MYRDQLTLQLTAAPKTGSKKATEEAEEEEEVVERPVQLPCVVLLHAVPPLPQCLLLHHHVTLGRLRLALLLKDILILLLVEDVQREAQRCLFVQGLRVVRQGAVNRAL